LNIGLFDEDARNQLALFRNLSPRRNPHGTISSHRQSGSTGIP
jgi:hypothetical protein